MLPRRRPCPNFNVNDRPNPANAAAKLSESFVSEETIAAWYRWTHFAAGYVIHALAFCLHMLGSRFLTLLGTVSRNDTSGISKISLGFGWLLLVRLAEAEPLASASLETAPASVRLLAHPAISLLTILGPVTSICLGLRCPPATVLEDKQWPM